MTATANTAFTAAQFNTYVRDNLNETAPAKATVAGQIFVATGANAIAARTISPATVLTAESTGSTTFAALTTAGPTAASVVTGTQALVIISCQTDNNSAGGVSYMGYDVSGSTTISASDDNSLYFESSAIADQYRASYIDHVTLTAGTNTFTAKYRVSAGTGTFRRREITVIPL